MFCCNLDKESLIGRYYDKEGFVYYTCGDDGLERFALKIKALTKPSHIMIESIDTAKIQNYPG
jgi:hypothetical protein